MSIIDKAVAAVTPPESEEKRRDARQRALALAQGRNDWLTMIIHQHEQIEQAFEAVREANDEPSRIRAHQQLAILLNGHSAAEEVTVYPALANVNEKTDATKAYTEHSATKMQLGLLETLPVMSREYLDKLEHIRGAVLHHVYSEEDSWLPELCDKLQTNEQQRLTQRFAEEFERHTGGEGAFQGATQALGARAGRTDGSSHGAPSYQS